MGSPPFRPRDKPTGILIPNPSASELQDGPKIYVATTVNSVNSLLKGSSPSIDFNVRFGPDSSLPGTALFTVDPTETSVTTGTDRVPDVTTIPAGSLLWFTTSARSGTVTSLRISLDLTP